VSAYEALAASYDRFTNDVPYEQVADFLESLLRVHGKSVRTVLDLACGTGTLSCIFAERGYSVLGADQSEEMLTQAYSKAMELPERPMFIHQSMQELELPQPVDLVVCTLDSLNYLTRPADCRETIRRVHDALNPGGVFLFDVNTPEKLRNLDGQVFLDEDEDQYCVWRASFDERENICYYGMDIFQRQGRLWRRSLEEHAEYAYALSELREYLAGAGFSRVETYGDLRMEAPAEGEQRVYFYAERN